MKSYYFKLLIILLSTLYLWGCKKSDNQPATLSITSLSVNAGVYNTVVTITGAGFSTTASANQVTFNGKAAQVKSATSTQITTIVPKGAGTGNVKITVNNATATGPAFTYVLSATVSTLAGNDKRASIDGTGTSASFNYPVAITTDKSGNVYVSDMSGNLIRKITPAGVVTTLAGSGKAASANGTGTQASFNLPYGIVADAAGNIYVNDSNNRLIRKITPDGIVSTLAGNSGLSISVDGTGTSAFFSNLAGLTIDATGNLYVTDGLLRKITPAGVVTTPSDTQLGIFSGLVIDAAGSIFTAGRNVIYKLINGKQTIFAGSGKSGSDNGPGAIASFSDPSGIAIDPSGNLLVTDWSNAQIRMITPDGVVSTIAGKLYGGTPIVDGPGDTATFNSPNGIAVDPSGIIYICETDNNRIRKIVLE